MVDRTGIGIGIRITLNHIDLFSGIGGFSIAASWAGFKTEVFCERDKFCQKILKKHWPGIPIIPEVRDFDGTRWRGTALLTGGFPCQPFSQAGKRRGKEDDRHLWPEMLRVISEARPRWVLGENVTGIINLELDTVLADLEGEGYEVGTVVLPACSKNAPHRRNRVWIVAHDESNRQQGERLSIRERQEKDPDFIGEDWKHPWPKVASRLCRMDAGISDRVDRLRVLGNAIVPHIAYEILSHMMEDS